MEKGVKRKGFGSRGQGWGLSGRGGTHGFRVMEMNVSLYQHMVHIVVGSHGAYLSTRTFVHIIIFILFVLHCLFILRGICANHDKIKGKPAPQPQSLKMTNSTPCLCSSQFAIRIFLEEHFKVVGVDGSQSLRAIHLRQGSANKCENGQNSQ